MRKRLGCCLLAVVLSATSGLAQFEGVLAMKLTLLSQDGREQRDGGTINLAIAKAGMRGEINLQLGPGASQKRVVLCKADTPKTNYLIDEVNKTYSEIDLSAPATAERSSQESAQWTVEKLGREKLLGYKTQHVLAKSRAVPGQSMELWVATDFLDLETYRKLQACTGGGMGGEAGLTQALHAAGADGMPLKVVITTEAGGRVKLEVVKAQKKSLPASTFEIPAGYSNSAGGVQTQPGQDGQGA